jgi:hypothetical protein
MVSLSNLARPSGKASRNAPRFFLTGSSSTERLVNDWMKITMANYMVEAVLMGPLPCQIGVLGRETSIVARN